MLTKQSLLYALVKTGRHAEIAELFHHETADTRMQIVTGDSEVTDSITENLWRPLTTIAPLRVDPIRRVLRYEFGDDTVTGVDIGAGPHITTPLLNSDRIRETDFPGSQLLTQYSKPVNLTLGMGVDLQDFRADPDWARAGLYVPSPDMTVQEFDALYETATQKKDVFPFLTLDATKPESSTTIQDEIERLTSNREVDFVLSSFVMHQLGGEAKRDNAKKLVEQTLREDGLWIVLGEELVNQAVVTAPSLKVYKKKQGHLTFSGKPFVLKPIGRGVESVNLDYFHQS